MKTKEGKRVKVRLNPPPPPPKEICGYGLGSVVDSDAVSNLLQPRRTTTVISFT